MIDLINRFNKLVILLIFSTLIQFRVLANTYLHSGWVAKKADEISESGEILSTSEYTPSGWINAIVPGTVLTTLIENGDYPDPYFGVNNRDMPDAYSEGIDFYTYWFRIEFTIPSDYADKRIWLHLRGINYTAEVYLNGTTVDSGYKGMFIRKAFDVTSAIDYTGTNYLAVKITPPDNPGREDGSNGGDGVIAKDITMQYTIGWDWVNAVRDRNAGIWDDVYIRESGPVIIQNPYIVTDLNLPDLSSAKLTISVDLMNASNDSQSGVLKGEIGNITFEQPVDLAGDETKEVIFEPSSFSQLNISNPRLWWPNGYGEQEIYNLNLSFETADGSVSDTAFVRFGIREFSYDYDPELVVKVNNEKIFCKGGNWVSTDAMLRFSRKRIYNEIRLHKEMNLTMIRVWGGGITERPDFYNACDEYGILVMQDFWITGDCNGRYGGSSLYPDDHELFIESAEDAIKFVRNHPSLCVWCGGNEVEPPSDINNALQDTLIPELDGTRLYVRASDMDGLHGHGPYDYQGTDYYSLSNGFTTELGTYSVPPVESMREMMNTDDLWPQNWDVWNYHNTFHGFDSYNQDIDEYGAASGIEDYCLKAQLVNYCSHRAMFESWNHKLWDDCSGVLSWKSQNCWPSLIWQFYDWYLEPNAGYFGIKSACEPLHIQMSLEDWSVYIINNRLTAMNNLKAEAWVYNLDGTEVLMLHQLDDNIDAPANTYTECYTISFSEASDLHFVKLQLRDSNDQILSENFYWKGVLSEVNNLPSVDLNTSASKEIHDDSSCFINTSVENQSDGIAFFIRLKVLQNQSGKRVLPSFYEDNYFSLLPGEKKETTIEFAQQDLNGEDPMVLIEGYNIVPEEIPINDTRIIAKKLTYTLVKIIMDSNPNSLCKRIEFEIPRTSYVQFCVYNARGSLVKTLVNKKIDAGNYTLLWNGKEQSSGIYLFIFRIGKSVFYRKSVVVK